MDFRTRLRIYVGTSVQLTFFVCALAGSSSCKVYNPNEALPAGGLGTGTHPTLSDESTTHAAWPSEASSTSVATQSSDSSDSSVSKPAECIAGQRQECSQDAHGHPVTFPGGLPRGNCRYGTQYCLPDNRWGPCQGTIAPVGKDDCSILGDDGNCNGDRNDGCNCIEAPNAKRECGSNVGACMKGIRSCIDGNWGECDGEIGPQAELCDGRGIDEDCDGYADVDDTDCECVNDTSIPCRLSAFQGDCALGHRRCVDGTLQACEALKKPEQERCGRADPDAFGRATGDEDCDGLFDEDSGPLPPLHCKIYHLDRDEDTWGAIGPSFLENPEKATHGCFCGLPPAHLNEFVPALPDRHNRDCGDCQFTGKHVNPTQERFFADMSQCLRELGWAGGFYDYNCNGVRELKHEGRREGTCLGDPVAGVHCHWSEDTTGFWTGDTPDCGKDGAELICSPNGSPDGRSCSSGTAVRSHNETTQSCR